MSLVLALAVLLTLVGWMFGGAAGLLSSAALAVAFLALSPTTSPTRLLRARGVRALHPLEAPALFEAARSLAQRAGLRDAPTLYLLPSATPRAVAGHEPRGAALGLSHRLLQLLTPAEVVAVLARELSHLRSGDLLVLRVAEVVLRMTRVMSLVGLLFLIVSLPLALVGEVEVPLLAVLFLVTAPWGVGALARALARSSELDADRGAVMLTGDPLALASALAKIDDATRRGSVAHRAVPDLLHTRPRTDRVERLLQMARGATRTGATRAGGRADEVIEPIWRRRPRAGW